MRIIDKQRLRLVLKRVWSEYRGLYEHNFGAKIRNSEHKPYYWQTNNEFR